MITVDSIFNIYMPVPHINYRYKVADTMPNPEKTMENCILMLQHIQEDSSIPRNIRRVADETRILLTNNSKAMGLRAAEAISKIDEISNDPNMPILARTRIWELVSQLETIPLD